MYYIVAACAAIVTAAGLVAAGESQFFVGTCGGDTPLLSLVTTTNHTNAVVVKRMGQWKIGVRGSWNVANPTKKWLYSLGGLNSVTAFQYVACCH